jgi:hypothetical protein
LIVANFLYIHAFRGRRVSQNSNREKENKESNKITTIMTIIKQFAIIYAMLVVFGLSNVKAAKEETKNDRRATIAGKNEPVPLPAPDTNFDPNTGNLQGTLFPEPPHTPGNLRGTVVLEEQFEEMIVQGHRKLCVGFLGLCESDADCCFVRPGGGSCKRIFWMGRKKCSDDESLCNYEFPTVP